MAQKGTFITFEGGEGCGKSTQIQRLEARLKKTGYCPVVTREPGGTDAGDQIRHILKFSYKSAPLLKETELLLFCASRAQLVREVILPALRRNKVVISDRFHDSTTVYQGVARKLDLKVVGAINEFAINDCRPDLTIVVDLPPKVGLARARLRGREQSDPARRGELFDRMENATLEFYNCVRQGYLDLAKREPRRVKLVDGNQSIEGVEQQIWSIVQHVLPRSA